MCVCVMRCDACMGVYVCKYICVCVCVCMGMYVCKYICVSVCLCMDAWMYGCMDV